MADDDPAAPAPDKAGPSEDTGKRLDEISERLNQALEKIGSLSTPPPIAVPAQQQPALWSAGFWTSAGLFVVSIACIVVGLMLQEMRGANWILLALVGALVAVGSLTMVSPPAWQGLLEFTKTGLFFMLAGICILFFTFSHMEEIHSSLTFVLVVLGVALLLFGTGTQGVGDLGTSSGGFNYNVVLAGGAGVVAFLVGFGLVYAEDPIRRAFQVERKYFRLEIANLSTGRARLDEYREVALVNNESVPTYVVDDSLVVLVPYDGNDPFAVKISFRCTRPASAAKCDFTEEFQVTPSTDTLHSMDGWSDFPEYRDGKNMMKVALIDDTQQLQLAQNRPPPPNQAGQDSGTTPAADTTNAFPVGAQ